MKSIELFNLPDTIQEYVTETLTLLYKVGIDLGYIYIYEAEFEYVIHGKPALYINVEFTVMDLGLPLFSVLKIV